MTSFLIGSDPGWIKSYEDSATKSVHLLSCNMYFLNEWFFDNRTCTHSWCSHSDGLKFKFTEGQLNIIFLQIIFLSYFYGQESGVSLHTVMPQFPFLLPDAPSISSQLEHASVSCYCQGKHLIHQGRKHIVKCTKSLSIKKKKY